MRNYFNKHPIPKTQTHGAAMRNDATLASPSHGSLTDDEYEFIAKFVADHAGIILRGERHRNMIYSRLIRRLRALNLPSFAAYCTLLQNDDSEIGHLINAVTTNVTSFFREVHHFHHLKEYLKHLSQTKISQKRLRIWSAACSSGEEPYSIAMTLLDAIPSLAQWDAKILATDIDTSILDRASNGTYPADVLENIPADYISKYTSLTGDSKHFTCRDNIKNLIHFKQINLLEPWKVKGPFDAIFCRNVFIYFTPETQRAIALRFAELLSPKGFLYIGHSENLMNMGTILSHEGKTIYKKN